MSDAIRALRKIAKQLEASFREISFLSAKHLAKSQKYSSEYMEEYRRLAKKIQAQELKASIKQNKKYKEERDRLRKQLNNLKGKKTRATSDDQQKSKKDKRKDRNESIQDFVSQREVRRQKKNKQRYESREDRYRHKKNEVDQKKLRKQDQKVNSNVIQSNRDKKQRQLKQIDFDRDFEFNRPYKNKRKMDNTIFEEEQSKLDSRVSRPKKIERWSDTKVQSFKSLDPQKYKILVVDEQNSDFQDENALLKVPQIKPRQPLTPYFLFLRANKHALTNSYPTLNSSRRYAKIWQDLPQEQKKPYEQQYTRARILYGKKLNQYYSFHPQQNHMNGEQSPVFNEKIIQSSLKSKKSSKQKSQGKSKNQQSNSKSKSKSKKKKDKGDDQDD